MAAASLTSVPFKSIHNLINDMKGFMGSFGPNLNADSLVNRAELQDCLQDILQ